MAYQPTTNYGWAMPRGGDQAQISVINQMFTAKADEIVYQTRRMIAPGYIDDGTKTYQPGEIVEYENVDYVCTGTTSGAWDSSKWDSTDMATQIQEAKESGGTNVVANPSAPATEDLNKLQVDTTVYGIPDPTVTKTATGNPIEITDGADAPLVKCVTAITGYQSGTGTPSPDNVRPITAYTEGEIEVSDGDGNTTTHTTTYPSTIYRGSVDVVNGTETHDMVVVDLGDLTWQKDTGADHSRFVANLSGLKLGSTIISDSFQSGTYNEAYNHSKDEVIASHSQYSQVVIHSSYYENLYDATQFKAEMSGHLIAYELATPTTSSVTPTNLPIKSLSGYSHIESSTGEMEVEYITQGYQPLVDLIQSNQHVYATTEQVVGKWVDGSTLYEITKTYTVSELHVGDWTQLEDLSNLGIDTLLPITGKMHVDTTNQQMDAGYYLRFNYQNGILYFYTSETMPSTGSITVVLRYTKSTATTRTLSKGATEGLKADLSEEKKEIEEMPETEEKTVKEAQSEGEEVTEKVETPTEKEENER